MKKPIRKTIPISELLVNTDNPRFESVTNQNQAIELMADEQGSEIKELAQDVIEHGLNPSKNLIVIESKNGKFLTLEGNRRLVSVTLLNNPNKTKDIELREYFQQLKNKYSDRIPDSISCMMFEKEDDALHWVMLEHTGPNKGVGIVKWDSEQRSRFIAQHKEQKSRDIQVFDFADEKKMERKNVRATNLQRVLSNSYACNAIGISFPNGVLDYQKSKSEVKKNLEKVFAAMSKTSFKVGDIYTKDLIEKWTDDVLSTKNSSKKTEQATRTSSSKSTSRKHLIPKDCHLTISIPKINDIFLELRDDLSLDGSKSVPNAVGVLFRVFLEVSLDHYLRKKMKIAPDQNMRIIQKINDVTKYMMDNKIATKDQLRSIRQSSTSQKTDILHIERFHEYVHSSTIQSDPASLKIKWSNVQEFFEILWEDLNKKGS